MQQGGRCTPADDQDPGDVTPGHRTGCRECLQEPFPRPSTRHAGNARHQRPHAKSLVAYCSRAHAACAHSAPIEGAAGRHSHESTTHTTAQQGAARARAPLDAKQLAFSASGEARACEAGEACVSVGSRPHRWRVPRRTRRVSSRTHGVHGVRALNIDNNISVGSMSREAAERILRLSRQAGARSSGITESSSNRESQVQSSAAAGMIVPALYLRRFREVPAVLPHLSLR
jgi:hypothetical protein